MGWSRNFGLLKIIRNLLRRQLICLADPPMVALRVLWSELECSSFMWICESWYRVLEIHRSRWTCPAKISNVRRRGKFSTDKMSGERKLSKMSSKEITSRWTFYKSVIIHKSQWIVCLNGKNVLRRFSFSPDIYVFMHLKMSGERLMVRRSQCPAKLKIILRTLTRVSFAALHLSFLASTRQLQNDLSSWVLNNFNCRLKLKWKNYISLWACCLIPCVSINSHLPSLWQLRYSIPIIKHYHSTGSHQTCFKPIKSH